MSNVVTNEIMWTLDTASATALVAAGSPVYIKKLVLQPAGRNDSCIIQDYDPAAAARNTIVMFGDGVDTKAQILDFHPYIQLNGMILSTLTSGAKLYVYFGTLR